MKRNIQIDQSLCKQVKVAALIRPSVIKSCSTKLGLGFIVNLYSDRNSLTGRRDFIHSLQVFLPPHLKLIPAQITYLLFPVRGLTILFNKK